MNRTTTVVLLDPDGELLGRLPTFDVPSPWWQESGDVVAEIQERYGLSVDLLRLLAGEPRHPPGGEVTYLAQARHPVGKELYFHPVEAALLELINRDEPLRAAYARPGGPARSLAWAAEILGPVTAVQSRTWNLSAIWRLESDSGTRWLKQLPAWLPNEPAALAWFAEVLPGLAPRVLAVGAEGRELLEHVPGEDLYGADLRTRLLIAEQAHRFQGAALPMIDTLLDAGLPDRRGVAMADWMRTSLAGRVLPAPVVDLLAGLDERMRAVAGCGVPDTLTHGDAGPGNARRDGPRIVFLDWSESVIAHPAFDVLLLAEELPEGEAAALLAAWSVRWRHQVPGCEPTQALDLLRPVAGLRSAAVYAEFVARIEPSEHPYHDLDVEHLLEDVVPG